MPTAFAARLKNSGIGSVPTIIKLKIHKLFDSFTMLSTSTRGTTHFLTTEFIPLLPLRHSLHAVVSPAFLRYPIISKMKIHRLFDFSTTVATSTRGTIYFAKTEFIQLPYVLLIIKKDRQLFSLFANN